MTYKWTYVQKEGRMKVLITSEYSKEGIKELEENHNYVVYDPWTARGRGYSAEETNKILKEGGFEGYITELDEVSDYVIQNNSKMKFIGDCRGNPTNIDMEAANKFGIPVFFTPARNAEAVAEMLIGTLLAFYRNIQTACEYVKNKEWNQPAPATYYKFQGNEICGKTVGFIGFGGIGRRTAELFDAFGAQVQFYDPYVKDSIYKSTTLEVLFSSSDIISIHLPVTPETKGIINTHLLRLMKKSAIFINTSRAAVVNYKELYMLLKERQIKGAILDVFNSEPPSKEDENLIDLDNVLSTPHICGATFEVVEHQSKIINKQVMQLKL